MVQNDKKFCLLRFISQEPYIMWLSSIVQVCQIIFLDVFFNFKILIFQVVSGLKGQKIAQNDKTFCKFHSVSQKPYIMWMWYLVHMRKMTISPGNLFISVCFALYCFFIGPFNSFFIIIYFSSSSINAKKKFWSVPHILHRCVIFLMIP